MKFRGLLFFPAAWALAACACLYLCPSADAGWGGGGCPSCGPVGPTVMPAPAPLPALLAAPPRDPADAGYRWRSFRDGDVDQIQLRRDGVQIGTYTYSTGLYYPLYVDRWGEPCAPPLPPPGAAPACKCDRCKDCRCTAQDQCKGALPGDLLPTGVVSSKIDGGERYTKNGVAVGRDEVFESVQAGGVAGAPSGTVPDDSGKPSLTLIGTDAEVAPALADLAKPENAAVRSAVLIQSYPPDATMVSGYGFAPGKPAVYLESPDGRVLYRRDHYAPETLFAAVRKADPLYDPKKDPDGTAADPLAALKAAAEKLPPWVYVAAAVGGLVWWRRRKR